MSLIYRVVAHCDRKDSGHCHGLLEVSSAVEGRLHRVYTVLDDKGWYRLLTAEGEADVCPGCQTPEEKAERILEARANGRKPVERAPVEHAP
jgi:hypothetical protein